MTTQPDTFTDSEVIYALEVALYLNRVASDSDRLPDGVSNVLRYHLDCLKAHQKDDLRRAEFHRELLKP